MKMNAKGELFLGTITGPPKSPIRRAWGTSPDRLRSLLSVRAQACPPWRAAPGAAIRSLRQRAQLRRLEVLEASVSRRLFL